MPRGSQSHGARRTRRTDGLRHGDVSDGSQAARHSREAVTFVHSAVLLGPGDSYELLSRNTSQVSQGAFHKTRALGGGTELGRPEKALGGHGI